VALYAHADDAQRTRNRRELTLFEAEPARIGRLIDFLRAGHYRDTAAVLAGLTSRSVRGWMEAAENGDGRFDAVANAIRIAEAQAEDESLRDVRSAGRDPRFWAASMTWLERKYPDRYGRRTEISDAPKVVLVNVKDSPIKVTLYAPLPAPVVEQPTGAPALPVTECSVLENGGRLIKSQTQA